MSASERIPAVLCYDVEDIVAPESDDAVLWMSEILSEHGLPGSFMVVGEKARLWERRGRRDVIESLKKHHVAYHSTWHSVHPTTTEICLDKNFAEGMDALWEWDKQGWADTERILGRPLIGWARTGNSWSPSVVGLMGRMGRAYAYSEVSLPGHSVCWYAGSLNFYGAGIGGFDEAFYDDARFTRRLAGTQEQIAAHVASERRSADWMCFFVCHPTRAISTMFWDSVNFEKGANPPRDQWKPAPQHPRELIPTMQANYHRMCHFLRDNTQLEVVGWGDLIHRYDGQRAFATHAELLEIAQRIADERQVIFTDFFTAGEILLLLCQATVAPAVRYPRPAVYGPLTLPPVSPSGELNGQAIKAVASIVLEKSQSGYLPASLDVQGQMVGIGTYFVALAGAILGHERVSGPANAPYPLAAEDIAREVAAEIPDWVIHPDNMDLSNLLEQTKLQCWTLKPAWLRQQIS
jgi:hypothetical protein